MGTLACFHAHPDDEAISTAGVMAKAATEGRRVILITATRGEVGEVADGFLRPGETLADRRSAETEAAGEILGADKVLFLGYKDSGMDGEPTNDDPDCFWQADLDEAADRLATILAEEDVDVFTCYDDHGIYGHPDHLQVYRVGLEAAERAGIERVYLATANRTLIRDRLAAQIEAAAEGEVDLPDPAEMEEFGTPDDEITTAIDVSAFVELKRKALAAHASQIGEDSFFLAMPDDEFAMAFGTEWFIRTKPEPDGLGPSNREAGLW